MAIIMNKGYIEAIIWPYGVEGVNDTCSDGKANFIIGSHALVMRIKR